MRTLQFPHNVDYFLISDSGKFLAAKTGYRVIVYNLCTYEEIFETPRRSFCFSHDHLFFVTSTMGPKTYRKLDCNTGKEETYRTEQDIEAIFRYKDGCIMFPHYGMYKIHLPTREYLIGPTNSCTMFWDYAIGTYENLLALESKQSGDIVFKDIESGEFVPAPTLRRIRLSSSIVLCRDENNFFRDHSMRDMVETPYETFYTKRRRKKIWLQNAKKCITDKANIENIQATSSLLFYSVENRITLMDLDSIV